MNTKVCKKCEITKDKKEFYKHKAVCKLCIANMSKIKNMLEDYYNEHNTFKTKNIIPLIKVFKEGYKEIIKN